jgi:hypothetical protein
LRGGDAGRLGVLACRRIAVGSMSLPKMTGFSAASPASARALASA